jgi:hypothetical protein
VATNGSQVWLWVMKRRGGGSCHVSNAESGCTPPGTFASGPALVGGLSNGGNRILFEADVRPAVAEIELRYQDGTRERLKPIEGFVLHEITPAHFPRGMRLTKALALDSKGRVLARAVQSEESRRLPLQEADPARLRR